MCAQPFDVSPTGPVQQRLLSVTEAAEFLRVEPAAVARSIRLGQLPSITVDGIILVDGERLIVSMREQYDGA